MSRWSKSVERWDAKEKGGIELGSSADLSSNRRLACLTTRSRCEVVEKR